MNEIDKTKNSNPINGVMFNAYPDSIGQNLTDIVNFFKLPEINNAFSLFYILPTFFNSDLDRGFSIINYDLNKNLVSEDDIQHMDDLNITLMFDLVLNHLSVASPQFIDLLENGEASEYKDFFIDWNEFWQSEGQVGPEGAIIPTADHLQKLFMRKPGLPILKIRFPDGSDRFYWNTFYQSIDSQGQYLGQMDLNAQSEKVWEFYDETLKKLASYGAQLIRLDAFAYLHKQVGMSNFFNKPGTWEYLERLKLMGDKYGLTLLPEIHTEYGIGLHKEMADQGFPIYDFYLPGLLIDSLERATNKHLLQWIQELKLNNIKTVNMLGCHDGIPVIDLKGTQNNGVSTEGLLSGQQIDQLIQLIIDRGGRIKNLYDPEGNKISYYQVNATYFSALGEDERKLILARAIQVFTPGIPQVWYLDLFAGKNNYAAADKAGSGGHKEINRTTLKTEDIQQGLKDNVVQKQLQILHLRNNSKAFQGELEIINTNENQLHLVWSHEGSKASLEANLQDCSFSITHQDENGDEKSITQD